MSRAETSGTPQSERPEDRRRFHRIHLDVPLPGYLRDVPVKVIDLSLAGALIVSDARFSPGTDHELVFDWNEHSARVTCTVVRCTLYSFAKAPGEKSLYQSGLRFKETIDDSDRTLRELIASYVIRALEEQKLNARGEIPQHDVDHMPIFRHGGQLTANVKDVEAGSTSLPTSRIAKQSGYICYHLENNVWRQKKTQDPGQPSEGFTIAATEDRAQADLLCEAYQQSDSEGRKMIQLFAQLSIMEGEGVVPGRFEP